MRLKPRRIAGSRGRLNRFGNVILRYLAKRFRCGSGIRKGAAVPSTRAHRATERQNGPTSSPIRGRAVACAGTLFARARWPGCFYSGDRYPALSESRSSRPEQGLPTTHPTSRFPTQNSSSSLGAGAGGTALRCQDPRAGSPLGMAQYERQIVGSHKVCHFCDSAGPCK
jgi:hypothetical protein